jgi:hypothetical protein
MAFVARWPDDFWRGPGIGRKAEPGGDLQARGQMCDRGAGRNAVLLVTTTAQGDR